MKNKIESLDNNIKGHIIETTIEENIKGASKVFIIGHIRPDYDSIASAAGILHLVQHLGKDGYIVIGDEVTGLDNDIKKIITDFGYKLNLINLEDYEEEKDDNSVLIMTDVNKKNRIFLKDNLDDFKKIIIIDHHDTKEGETVKDAIQFIYPSSTSASELVTQALLYKENKSSKNKSENRYIISKDTATLLYAGIYLDTDRFKSKTTKNLTHAVADKLLERGANKEYVDKLFRNDRASYNKIAYLIVNGTIIRQYTKDFTELGIAFSLNRNFPNTLYNQEELAKAATMQLDFKDTDAAFTVGYTKENQVGISARSCTEYINVGKIMEKMNGGGSAESAASTEIHTDDIEEVEDQLIHIVEDHLSLQDSPVINLEPDLTDEPQSFKKTKIKRRKK